MAHYLRIITRLDIKNPNLIKSVQLEGVKVIGDPIKFAEKYYIDGADEIIYMDAVASLYNRNSVFEIINKTAENIFIPMTVGGGLKNIEDVGKALKNGADKVAINTAIVKDPSLIKDVFNKFGAQCMVIQIDAKKKGKSWEVLIDGGREKTGIDIVDWVKEVNELGAGEILITSVDREGSRKGMDIELINCVSSKSSVPVIASGGIGDESHVLKVVKETNVDAIAIADMFHYNRSSIKKLKNYLKKNKIKVRM